ncbi:hypothetical protein NDU88_001226, partial [Pleurodeles waltl]
LSCKADSTMDPHFPIPSFEATYLSKLLNDSSMMNLSTLPSGWYYNSTSDTFLPLGIKLTIVIVYLIVCVLGLVGNCAVMFVI